MALALYRKYRPATFAEVVGQDHVTQPLRTALAAGRINHAYLFSGPRGCGKTSSARIMARSLNCVEGPTPDPCGVCPSCVALAPEGPGSLDVVELDAASHGGVEDTRDLRDRAFYMPAESRYRVFIIDEAHMVSAQGFNALLKIVEEPPEHLVFIFATTEPDKVMTTIRSRTHHYPFRLIPPATLRKLLERLCTEEQVHVEPAVFPLVIQAGGGSARDSLSILDQLLAGAGPDGVTYRAAVALLGVTDAALLDETVDALAANDGASVFEAIDKVVEAGHDPRRFASDLLQRFRDLVIIAAVPEAGAKGLIDAPEDQLTAMYGQSGRLGAGTLTRLAEVLHTGLTDMRGTTAPRLALELMCARMLLPAASGGEGALVQRVERIEQVLAGGATVALPAAKGAATPSISGQAPAVPVSGPSALPATASATATPATQTAPEPAAKPAARGASSHRRSAGRSESGPPTAGTPSAGKTSTQPPVTSHDLGLPPPPVLSGGQPGPRPKPAAPAAAPTAVPPSVPPSDPSSVPPSDGDWLPPDAPPDEDEYGDPPPAPPAPSAPVAPASVGTPAPDPTPASVPASAPGPAPAPDPAPAAAPPSARELAAPASRAAVGPSTAPPVAPKPMAKLAAPVPSTSVPSEIGVTDARRVWTEVLAAVQRRKKVTQAMLVSATVVDLRDRTLILALPAHMAKRIMEPANRALLHDALREVLGVDWEIRSEVAGDPAAIARATLSLVPSSSRESEDGAPDGYDSRAPDPRTGDYVVRDPEEAAIELLTQQLGAKRIDG